MIEKNTLWCFYYLSSFECFSSTFFCLFREQANTARKATKRTKQTGTKILVRNVPFQATKNEISELFRTFGEIKALRLPKKVGFGEERHRGFAFVDFVTESDAKVSLIHKEICTIFFLLNKIISIL